MSSSAPDVPTMNLRFIEKPMPIAGTGMVHTVKKIRVLQQLWCKADNSLYWADVRFEANPGEKP